MIENIEVMRVRREWEPEDLIASWTLVDDDWHLVGNKSGATRLGFSLLLKFFELEARFPRHPSEVPSAAVRYVAGQVKVEPGLFGEYEWSGSTIEYHRAQVRLALGFREPTRADEERLTGWLAAEICPVEMTEEGLKTALWARCRAERIEPPGRTERILGAAPNRFEQQFCAEIVGRLSAEAIARLEELLTEPAATEEAAEVAGGGRAFFADLKADPGRLGLETLLEETTKLSRVRDIGLPADLFAGYSERLVAAWRAGAAVSYPSHLLTSPAPVRLTLLAALCWSRTSEITDALVELLIRLVLKINTRAERKVEKAIFADLKRVHGKTGILFRVAEAAVEHPDETVRSAVFPVVGEKTLFLCEYLTSEALRREIHEGLQVVENWNSANADLFYGKNGGLTGGDKEHQEVSMLALHLLQSALVFVNTLLLQQILAEDDWAKLLTTADKRALTPQFWSHANLYGRIDLDMDTHLDLALVA